MYTCIYINMYICMYVYIYVCICINVYIYEYLFMCIYIRSTDHNFYQSYCQFILSKIITKLRSLTIGLLRLVEVLSCVCV